MYNEHISISWILFQPLNFCRYRMIYYSYNSEYFEGACSIVFSTIDNIVNSQLNNLGNFHIDRFDNINIYWIGLEPKKSSDLVHIDVLHERYQAWYTIIHYAKEYLISYFLLGANWDPISIRLKTVYSCQCSTK